MNSALFLREKVTRLVKLLVGKSIQVTQRGSTAYVTWAANGRPKTVNVPYIPEDASLEFMAAIEGFLDHEVAHVLFTDYAVVKKANEVGVASLHNVIEDAFIEKKMGEVFPGSADNLATTGRFFLENFTDKKIKEDPANAASYLMIPAVRALAGQHVWVDYMKDKWPLLERQMEKAGDYLREHLPKMVSSADALGIAVAVRKLLEQDEEKPTDERNEGEPGTKPGSKSKRTKGKPTEEAEPEPAGDRHSEAKPGEPEPGEGDDEKGEGEEDGAETEAPGGESGDESKSGTTPGASEGDGEPQSGESDPHSETGEAEDKPQVATPTSVGADEVDTSAPDSKPKDKPLTWDEFAESVANSDYDDSLSELLTTSSVAASKHADYLIYTQEDDVIEPLETNASHDSHAKQMVDAVDHMVGPLQKDLERAVAARSRANWTAGHRSGRLHGSSLARLTAFGDDRVFRRKHENYTKDVAVGLLVDCSGSMSGEKIRIASYAAYALTAVLDRMGISCEALGFTTRGSFGMAAAEEGRKLGVRYSRMEPLFMPILKDFNERLTSENKRRFGALSAAHWLNQNVDGECVQIAAHRLSKRREARKVLIVLSDGNPHCPGTVSALYEHLKLTVKQVSASGIDVLGIGIQDESVKKYYPKHVIINDVRDLPTTVIAQIKTLLMHT